MSCSVACRRGTSISLARGALFNPCKSRYRCRYEPISRSAILPSFQAFALTCCITSKDLTQVMGSVQPRIQALLVYFASLYHNFNEQLCTNRNLCTPFREKRLGHLYVNSKLLDSWLISQPCHAFAFGRKANKQDGGSQVVFQIHIHFAAIPHCALCKDERGAFLKSIVSFDRLQLHLFYHVTTPDT